MVTEGASQECDSPDFFLLCELFITTACCSGILRERMKKGSWETAWPSAAIIADRTRFCLTQIHEVLTNIHVQAGKSRRGQRWTDPPYDYTWIFPAKLCFPTGTVGGAKVQREGELTFPSRSDNYDSLQNYGIINLQDRGNNDSVSFYPWVLENSKTMLPILYSKITHSFMN